MQEIRSVKSLPKLATRTFEAYKLEVNGAMAEYLLSLNQQNRPVDHAYVRRYAQAMSDGLWKPGVKDIVFNQAGVLIDGQHTLKACVSSKVTIHVILKVGMLDEAKFAIDCGKPRTISNAFAMSGKSASPVLRAVLRLMFAHLNSDRGKGSFEAAYRASMALDPSRIQEIKGLMEGENLPLHLTRSGAIVPKARSHGIGSVAFFSWLTDSVNPELSEKFFQELRQPECHVQLKALFGKGLTGIQMTAQLGLLFRHWNSWVAGVSADQTEPLFWPHQFSQLPELATGK